MKKHLYKIRLSLAVLSLVLSILGFLGIFYKIKILNLQFSPLLERIVVDFSIFALLAFIVLIFLTFIFGRFYCSLICPFGIMQEIVSLIYSKFKKKNSFYKNLSFKYFIAALAFGALISASTMIIKYIDPYTIFGSFISLSLFGIIFSILIFILVFFKNRYFCSNICPVGAVLGLISKFSIFKMCQNENCVSCSLCAKNCPVGCIDYKNKTIDNERCIKCFKCISVCKKNAISYTKPSLKIKFSPSRRNVIKSVSIAAVFALGYGAGLKFSQNLAKKIKDIILPPGAKNTQDMTNKCLNCNLCINNCPNKILSKADENFKAVHVDFKKGKGYCEYDCTECSKVCPSGAIKKITLKEKQNTRIAMANIDNNACVKCMRCVDLCPKKAIFINENKDIIIDGTKCIGCGKCSAYCPQEAIKIFSTNEQKLI